MVKSQGWKWENVSEDWNNIWKTPSMESYYLLHRWKEQNKNSFLDLGCGIGRHSILFAENGFDTYCFDISEEAIKQTKEWAECQHLNLDYRLGDMIKLPYESDSMDCILAKNVISHTDTQGVTLVISEINRVLKIEGECYLTLCSKNTWGYLQDWPAVDENTKLCMNEGPEYKVPHFYADYNLIKELFSKFMICSITHCEEFYEVDGKIKSSYHYHVLIKKTITEE